MLLDGKVAIVTGGASGIGEASAKLFAAHGASVAIADINDIDAPNVIGEIRRNSGRRDNSACFIPTDVSSEEQVRALVDEVMAVYGRMDILFNNAAVILPKPLEDIGTDEWSHLFDINLKSMYLTIKMAIPHIRKTRGSIVNMASLNGLVGQKQNAAYSASKGGIIAMTKALALDYAADGVRVNCICPAGVRTTLLEKWIARQDDPAATRQALDAMHPLGRMADSEEIAKAAVFLASDLGSFVTGAALPVDGGASLGY